MEIYSASPRRLGASHVSYTGDTLLDVHVEAARAVSEVQSQEGTFSSMTSGTELDAETGRVCGRSSKYMSLGFLNALPPCLEMHLENAKNAVPGGEGTRFVGSENGENAGR